MPEQTTINAEMFEVKADQIPFSLADFDSLIGRAAEADILMSAIPYYDESGIMVNFPELSRSGQEFIGLFTSGSAFLLAGEAGNGKKTLDSTLLTYVSNYMRDLADGQSAEGESVTMNDLMRCFLVKGSGLRGETGKDTAANIDAFFDGIDAMCADSEKHPLLFISLGDITPIAKKKRTAQLLAERVTNALGSLNAQCVITARLETADSDIPDSLRGAFTTLYLSPPDSLARREYLDKFTESYPVFTLGKNTEILIDETEGFSFRMMKQLTEMLLMTAKGRITSSKLKLEDYASYSSAANTETIHIDDGRINAILTAIKSSAQKKRTDAVMPYVIPAPQAAAGPAADNTDDSAPPPTLSDPPRGGRESLALPDSFTKIDEYRRSLKIPSSYTPPGYIKKAEDSLSADELIERVN